MRKQSRFDTGPIRNPSGTNVGNNSALASLNQQLLFSASSMVPGQQLQQVQGGIGTTGGMGMPDQQAHTHMAPTSTIPQQQISSSGSLSGLTGFPGKPGMPAGMPIISGNTMNPGPVPTITIKMSDTLSAFQHQASTKDSRELFVGNLNNVNNSLTSMEVLNFFNTAMRQANLNTSNENPVISCRMSQKFCFVEFRSIEDCNAGLNLNGIPFMDHFLKIGRPAKYNGPFVKFKSWQEITGQAMGEEVSNIIRSTAHVDPMTKIHREIFVGNTTGAMTESIIRNFFEKALQKLGLASSEIESPIINIRMNNKFCFIEFRSIEEASNCLNLNEAPLLSEKLRVSRPTKYVAKDPTLNYLVWDDVFTKWMTGELSLLTSGTPSCILFLSNIFRENESSVQTEIIEDTQKECKLFAPIDRIFAHNNKHLFVVCETIQNATDVLCGLKGRSFKDRYVDINFYPHEEFSKGNYEVESPTIMIAEDGIVRRDQIL
jgi:RNA recognition motif-containing protein